MGITVEQWRQRIGRYSQPAFKEKVKIATIKLHNGVFAGGLRLAVAICLLLILAGDVEENPGPARGKRGVVDTTFRPERTTRQTTLFGATGGLEPNEPHTLTQIESLHKEVMDLKELVEKFVETVERLEQENAELQERYDRMENQSRRDNLVFYGIPESDRETWEESEKKIREHAAEYFGVERAKSDEELPIERAHRVGKRSHGRARPVVVRFTRWKDKEEILHKARQKTREWRERSSEDEVNNRIRVSEDFSARVREIRRKLVNYMQTLRQTQPNTRMSLRFDKLFVDGKMLTYDTESESVIEIETNKERPSETFVR